MNTEMNMYTIYENLKDFPGKDEDFLNEVHEMVRERVGKRAGSFNSAFFNLLYHADFENRTKLKLIFRMKVLAWEAWHYSEGDDAFCERWLPIYDRSSN